MLRGVDKDQCTLSPDGPVVAGQFGTWTATYTDGSQPILPGGGIAVVPPCYHGVRWRVGHVVVATTGECSVAVRSPVGIPLVRNGYPLVYHHAQFPIVFVTVQGGALRPGEQIRITLGDPGAFVSGFFERARAQELAMRGAVWQVLVDPLGNGDYSNPAYPGGAPKGFRLLPDLPVVDVLPAAPHRVVVVAPGRVGPKVDVRLRVEDEYGNVCDGFEGEVILGMTNVVPLSAGTLGAGDEVHIVSGLARAALTVPDNVASPLYVTALSAAAGIAGTSNPIEVVPAAADRVFFGDLHAHAPGALSESRAPRGAFTAHGFGTYAEAYAYGRDVAALDFIALAWFPPPRGVEVLWSRPRPSDWAEYQEITRYFHAPGRFVAFEAVELSDPPTGHRVVVFPGEGSPELGSVPTAELWPLLERSVPSGDTPGAADAVVIPHHTNVTSEGGPQNWQAQDWSAHHPHFQRVMEIAQSRGAFEVDVPDAPDGPTVIGGFGSSARDALRRGCRVGFTGGSDNHYAQPGTSRCPMAGVDFHDYVTGGLTAVLTPQLTREAVHAALRARRCYATTGARLLLDFRVDGHLMGDEFATAAGDVRIAARVAGTAPIARAEIVRDGEVVFTSAGGAHTVELDCRLALGGGTSFFYLRVTQADRQMAWSSPIWVDRTLSRIRAGDREQRPGAVHAVDERVPALRAPQRPALGVPHQ